MAKVLYPPTISHPWLTMSGFIRENMASHAYNSILHVEYIPENMHMYTETQESCCQFFQHWQHWALIQYKDVVLPV